jgi:hypothetical protein
MREVHVAPHTSPSSHKYTDHLHRKSLSLAAQCRDVQLLMSVMRRRALYSHWRGEWLARYLLSISWLCAPAPAVRPPPPPPPPSKEAWMVADEYGVRPDTRVLPHEEQGGDGTPDHHGRHPGDACLSPGWRFEMHVPLVHVMCMCMQHI